ncbi:MAG TPA: phenylalanine--tRNA ligase subunit alpha, partial [Actinomycetota bacterium]|nr:phenylalanine--tRNA ligase subunit alpha [Actinomycetota bacterium]
MDPDEALRILEAERVRGLRAIAAAGSLEDLEAAKVAVLGRRAPFTDVQRSLGSLGEEDRRRVGRVANEVRSVLRAALDERRLELARAEQDRLLRADAVDVTLPGRRPREGSLHPLTIVEREIVQIFTRMGYRVAEGPEVEDDWHNFE